MGFGFKLTCLEFLPLLGQNKEVHGKSKRGNRKERRSVKWFDI